MITKIVNKLEKLKEDNGKLDEEIAEMEEKVAEKLKGKEETKERKELNSAIDNYTGELASLEKELALFQRNDPKRFSEMSKGCELYRKVDPRLERKGQ